MAKTTKRLEEIFDRYVDKIASEQEQLELWDYIKDPMFAGQIDSLLDRDYRREHDEPGLSENQKSEMLQNILGAKIHQPRRVKLKVVRPFWKRVAVAASILLIASLGIYFYSNKPAGRPEQALAYASDIAPGKNGATLTLANGQKILIKDALAGNIATQSGVKISKTADGQIVYELTGNNSGEIAFNTLEAGRGQQTQVRLPDGTLVFLNAESSLRYPTSFSGSIRREVALTGEGYFEVAKDKLHPFLVKTDRQDVEVLGTHFNISAYPEDRAIRTTLIEGAVKVSAGGTGRVLRPGEQSTFNGKTLALREVDAENAIAWKNGMFIFDDEPLQAIMQRVARWYDVEIVYSEGVDKEKLYWGGVSRFDHISQVLRKLELTGGVHFKIERGRITVLK